MTKFTRAKLARGFVSLLDRYSVEQLLPVLAEEVVRSQLVNQIDLLLMDINRELVRQQGHLEADTISAYPLSDAVQQQLIAALKQATGAGDVTLNHLIDPTVVGGVVARTPELELNLTIEAKLRRLAA